MHYNLYTAIKWVLDPKYIGTRELIWE